MQLKSKSNKGFSFLLCVIDIYSKYRWVISLKNEKGTAIINAFQKRLDESTRKPSKLWVDKGSEFYNRSMLWLGKNAIEMDSTHNPGKSVAAERFIKTLRKKICKYMTSISKNVYNDKLDDKVNKYNNTNHRATKMKPADVKSSTYIDFRKENNKEDPEFTVSNHVRTSKYKSMFAKGYVPNWSQEVFPIKTVKNTVPWTYVISDLNEKEIVGTFHKK